MQQGQPVTFSSRALTTAETRYSQIEKELLALIFGLERNHQFTYGRKIKLWTDHKPLVSISKKQITTAPKRLQRLLLRLVQYDVDIVYKPGKEMYLADTLSRAFLQNEERSAVEVETESVNIIDFLPVSKATRKQIQDSTNSDPVCQNLKRYITEGWPEDKKLLPTGTSPYFQIRDELSIHDGIIFKAQRCVIPTPLRRDIKEKLHNSHTGIESTLRRARDTVYWPGMSKEVKDYVEQCSICNTYRTQQSKEPLV
ncbi:hypothetical protein BSL78_20701, partial [Apostichopus japonicus]